MKPEEAVATWRNFYTTMKKADSKVLELSLNPETTDEVMLDVIHARRVAWAQFKQTTETLIEHCYAQGKPTLARSIEATMKGETK